MSFLSSLVDDVTSLHGAAAYSIVGLLAFAEAGLLIGFVLPGETAVILGGVLAGRHSVSLPIMITVAVSAAILGDSAGYEMGRRGGPRLMRSRVYAKHQAGLDRGVAMLRRLGGKAVLLARFTAFLRAVMPALAGMTGLRYRTFLVWNAAGGLIWASGFTLLGYAAGDSYSNVEAWAGRGSALIAVGIAAIVVVVLIRRRRAATPTPTQPADPAADTGADADADEGSSTVINFPGRADGLSE